MDEHLGTTNIKVNILTGVKEVLARAAVVDNTRAISNYLDTEEDGYPSCALYRCIKHHILCNIDEHISKEIKSIKTIGYKFTKLAINASARKLIASPEVISVMIEVKEGVDDVLRSFYYCHNDARLLTLGDIGYASAQNRELISNRYGKYSDYETLPLDSLTPDYVKKSTWDLGGEKGLYKNEIILLKLSKASLAEVFETPCWTNVRLMLRKCLSDDNRSVFFHALKLHAKFLLSSSNVAMYESFLNLKVSLLDQFLNGKYNNDLPNFNEGISFSRLSHLRLLKTMNLVIEFFRDRSKNYVRLPIKLIEEIVGNMVDMVAFLPDNVSSHCNEIYPLHLISVLDPKACWFKMCCYYTCVRHIVFKKLLKTPKLLIYILKTILSWLHSLNVRNTITNSVSELDQLVCKGRIKFATFSHSLHLYSSIMCFDEGRNIIWNSDGGITPQEIFNSIVTYMNNATTPCKTARLLQILLNHLLTVPKNGGTSNIFVTGLVLNPMFQVYQEMIQNRDSKTFPMIKPYVVDHIKFMLQSKIGRDSFLVCQKFNFGKECIEMCPARILLVYTCTFLKKLPGGTSDLLKNLLTSCALLGHSPKGFIEIEECNLIPTLAILYRQIKGQNRIGAVKGMSFYSDLMSEETCLLDMVTVCLMSLTANSGRVWLIEREGILLPILYDYYKKPLIPWENCWFQKLVISSTLMTGGCDALVGEQVQRFPLSNLWKSWGLDGTATLLSGKGPENSQNALNIYFSMCSTLRGVKALLVEREGSEETLTEGMNPPSSLQEVLEVTLGLTEDSSGQGMLLQDGSSMFANLDEVYFGLRLLRFMMSNLDTNLLLQNKFLIQEHVMKIRNENLLEDNGEIIIDEITIMCDQILGNSLLVDSSAERNVCLTKSIASRNSGNLQHRSITSTIVPRLECLPEWILCSSNRHRSRSRHTPRRLKNDLVKFLGNTRHGLRDVNWLNQLRRVHRSAFIGNNSPEIKSNVLLEILEEVQKAYASIPHSSRSSKFQWPDHNALYSLFPEDLLGIKLTVRYGAKLSLLQSTPLVHSNFAQMLRSTYGLVKVVRDEFLGFDWFLATVFLLCCGNIDRCQLFINNLVRLQVAPFLWVTYGEFLSNTESFGKNYRNDFLFLLIQQVELLLSIEVPKVFAAFQSSAASVAVLVQQWMCQCFWNILDWSEIKNFLCIAIIYEPDYIIYFCVAILLHLEPLILHTVSTSVEHFWERLKITPVGHFRLGNYFSFIEKLSKIHHNNVLRSIMKCTSEFNKP